MPIAFWPFDHSYATVCLLTTRLGRPPLIRMLAVASLQSMDNDRSTLFHSVEKGCRNMYDSFSAAIQHNRTTRCG